MDDKRKKVFDKEYKTQYQLENLFLKESGIRYEFVYSEDGITTWKYKKNSELFEKLLEFWKMLEKNN